MTEQLVIAFKKSTSIGRIMVTISQLGTRDPGKWLPS